MCGVIGVNALGDLKDSKLYVAQREAMIRLFTNLVQITRSRGEDATGTMALYEDGNFKLLKDAVSSLKFIANVNEGKDYTSFINFCRSKDENARLKTLMGHCRKSSVGGKWDNVNNHPIKAGNIVGVHNGTLKNHDIIFEKLACQRDGIVDSEAIMRLIEHFTEFGSLPFTVEMMEQIAIRLDGAATTLSLNVNNPYQMAFTRKTRTMEMCLVRPLKLLITASEKDFIENVLYEYNKSIKYFGDNCNGLLSPITSHDIDIKMIADDRVGYVDLTVEIDEASKVDDVIATSDVWKIQKLWEKTYAGNTTTYPNNRTTYGNQGRKTGGQGNSTTQSTKTTQNGVKSGGTGSGTKKDGDKSAFAGRVFCKKLGKYVSDAEAAQYEDVGAVIVDEENGKVVGVNTHAGSENENKKTTQDTKEVGALQKVDDIPFVGKTPPNQTTVTTLESGAADETTTDVNLARVRKEADHGANALLRYSNETDVAEALGIQDGKTVLALPAHALANRVREHVYKEAFIDGAKYLQTLLVRTPERAVAMAKRVTLLLSNTVTRMCVNNPNIYGRIIREEQMKGFEDITKEGLLKVFSAGDIRNNKPLAELEKSVD